MAARFTTDEVRHLILRENGNLWSAFACVGIPTDRAPERMVADVAEANDLIARLNAVFGRIEAALDIEGDWQ